MDIDCDGRPTARCNRRTDPEFLPTAAYEQSDGRRLNAERLPYIVLPAPSRIWNHRAHGLGGGSVAAVVYRGQVRYAVVGDTGPRNLIGEASYSTARRLGIPADPREGGVGSGVTPIVFEHARVGRIEDHAAAVAQGERLAQQLVSGGGARAGRPGTASAGAAPRCCRARSGGPARRGDPARLTPSDSRTPPPPPPPPRRGRLPRPR